MPHPNKATFFADTLHSNPMAWSTVTLARIITTPKDHRLDSGRREGLGSIVAPRSRSGQKVPPLSKKRLPTLFETAAPFIWGNTT